MARKRSQSGNTHRFTQKDAKKISNWKTPGRDRIHGFWFKKFTSIHDRQAQEINRCLERAHVSEWMTKGSTTLIQKDPSKGITPNNYRPITCLPIMWKILTVQIREEIYYSLTSRGLFPEEQKGCRKGSIGTEDLLYKGQHILNESKTRRKNLAVAWIDYKKAYDTVPQNVQNIRWSHKLHGENHENLESRIDSRRKKLSWSKDPKRYFSRRCTITLTIHNSHDAT